MSSAVRVAETLDLGMFLLPRYRNARFRGSERGLGPGRYEGALFLGQGGVQVQKERICIRAKVGHNERDAMRDEAADEVNVAAVGDRRKLLAAIAELAAPSPSAEPRSPPSAAERPKTLRPRPSGVRSQAELGKVSAPRFEMCGLRR
jgi:hypothetical protein